MNWQKRGLQIGLIVVLSLLVVSCAQGQQLTLKDIWDAILSIGKLEFLGFAGENALVAFMRIMIGILVFALLFEGSRAVGLARNIGTVVALVLSIISVIFIPGSILAGIGGAYATLIAFVLIGVPVVGGFYVLIRIPSTSRGWIALKMVIIVLLIWILSAVKANALTLLGAH